MLPKVIVYFHCYNNYLNSYIIDVYTLLVSHWLFVLENHYSLYYLLSF